MKNAHRPGGAARLGGLLSLALLALCGTAAPGHAAEAPPRITAQVAVPAKATPIMPLNQVRIGMEGYGLTVFHGTKIEPFPVKVESIVSNSRPNGSVIWIICDDPRLNVSGPVEGMSGSPIFLWDKGEPHVMGKGGRLIGAFAFGYSLVKECLAGVQPIQYMRHVGKRALAQTKEPQAHKQQATAAELGRKTLDRLAAEAAQYGLAPQATFRLNAIRSILRHADARPARAEDSLTSAAIPGPKPPAGLLSANSAQAAPLLLPMSVGSAELANVFNPLLQPLGLNVVNAGQGVVSGPPPYGIDPNKVKLRPGGVLAIPLAIGDLDLNATGTVTDVLPDGTVLGFGHPMFGTGRSELPMATGYVHFVVPRVSTSFKLAGSLRIGGSIVEDESTAVAGVREKHFTFAPVEVKVEMPHQATRTYHYQVVNNPQMTPMLAAIVALQSITSDQKLPVDNTLYLKGNIDFAGDRSIKLDTVMAGGDARTAAVELLPVISAMIQNPYHDLDLTGMKLTVRVSPEIHRSSLINAKVDRDHVAPGDTVGVTVWLQPYAGKPYTRHIDIKVPADTPDGAYPLVIGDGDTYLGLLHSTKPYLFMTRSLDDLYHAVQRVEDIRRNQLYVALQLPSTGLAVGRSELPKLPSSQRALILNAGSTLAMPYTATVLGHMTLDGAVNGSQSFQIHVKSSDTTAQNQDQN